MRQDKTLVILPPRRHTSTIQVMKPVTTLRNFVAPSPQVLSFLRSQVRTAFLEPTPTCRSALVDRNGGARHVSTRAGDEILDAKGRPTVADALKSGCQTRLAGVYGSPSCRRAFSTSPKIGWRLWPARRRPPPPPPAPKYTSPLAGVMEDATNLSSLGRAGRPVNELRMRCTELDEHGNVTMVSGEYKKTDLIAKVHTLEWIKMIEG